MRLAGLMVCAALLAFGSGCSGPQALLDPAHVASDAEGVRVSVRGSEIVLANHSSEPVRFAVVEREFFEHALALWSFGFGSGGTLVAAGRSGSVQLADVSGYTHAAREVVLFWWYERPTGPDESANGVRQVTVPLHSP